MLTEEQAANAYEEVTVGCRRLVRLTNRQCSAMAAGQAGRRDKSSGGIRLRERADHWSAIGHNSCTPSMLWAH